MYRLKYDEYQLHFGDVCAYIYPMNKVEEDCFLF